MRFKHSRFVITYAFVLMSIFPEYRLKASMLLAPAGIKELISFDIASPAVIALPDGLEPEKHLYKFNNTYKRLLANELIKAADSIYEELSALNGKAEPPISRAAIINAVNTLAKMEKGDYASKGYTQTDKVVWHDFTHCVNNTIRTLKSVMLFAGTKPASARAPILSAGLLTCIAGLMHDIGYYKTDSYGYGTTLIEHEQRSKIFIMTENPGLDPELIPLINFVIASTEFDLGPDKFNQFESLVNQALDNVGKPEFNTIVAAIKEKMSEICAFRGDMQYYQPYNAGLKRLIADTITIESQYDLYFLLGINFGAKALGTYDICETRARGIELLANLREEFRTNKVALLQWLSAKTNIAYEANDSLQSIKSKIEDAVARDGFSEYDKTAINRALSFLPKFQVEKDYPNQVADKYHFYKFIEKRLAELGVFNEYLDPSAKILHEIYYNIARQASEAQKGGSLTYEMIPSFKKQQILSVSRQLCAFQISGHLTTVDQSL